MLWVYLNTILLGLVGVCICFFAFFDTYRVMSDSMLPVLEIGNRMTVDTHFYRFWGINQGDVIVFRDNYTDLNIVHRVIAVEGNMVTVKDRQLYVNDKIVGTVETATSSLGTLPEGTEMRVPAGFVFQKGDNAQLFYGLISKDDIIGKVVWSW